MNNIFELLRTLLICILISSIHSDPTEQPYIFNPYTREVFDIQGESSTYKGGPYAAACPAEHQREINFMQIHSLNNKSLFIRYYSDNRDEHFGQIKCKTPIEISLVYFIQDKTKQFEFGYEIFYDRSKFAEKKFHELSFYPKFRRVSEKLSRVQRFFGLSFVPQTPFMKLESDNPRKQVIQMGFQWMLKTSFSYNKPTLSTIDALYWVRKKVDKPWVECKDFILNDDLSEKWYEKETFDSVYSVKNQEAIFRSLEYPENTCQSKYNCLKEHSLVPPYELQSTLSKSNSCSHFVSIPIWFKMIESVLNYLDKLLAAVAQIADKELRIYVQLHDTLALPMPGKRRRKYREIYLHQKKKKIPVPKIIIKIVKYGTYNCVLYDDCWYYVLIVIHNEPVVAQDDKLCTENKCQQWGWGSILYQNTANEGIPSEHVYCCEFNKKLKKILKMKKKTYEHLDLNNFPYYNKETKQHEYKKNKLALIETKVNELIKLEKSEDQKLTHDSHSREIK